MKLFLVTCSVFLSSQLIAQSPLREGLSVPRGADQSYEKLIDYVAQTYQTQEEIAEFFYYWMAQNIQYDYSIEEGFFLPSGQAIYPDALHVFKSKKTICSGYATLYKLFLNEFEIECEVVHGYAKSKEVLIQSDSMEIAHAWNAIKLNDSWTLVDVTWASTTQVDGRISSFYYQAPPELFVFNHLPFIAYWQLLAQPISLDDFRRSPEVNAEYFDLGFATCAPKVAKENGQFKLTIGKSKKWKPVISKSLTGKDYQTIDFKRKDKGEYQELIFSTDDSQRFIIRLDAHRSITQQRKLTQTQLAYLVME